MKLALDYSKDLWEKAALNLENWHYTEYIPSAYKADKSAYMYVYKLIYQLYKLMECILCNANSLSSVLPFPIDLCCNLRPVSPKLNRSLRLFFDKRKLADAL